MTRLSIIILAITTLLTLSACATSQVNHVNGNTREYEPNSNQAGDTNPMVLLDNHNNPIKTDVEIYATTGFEGNVAFVAQCIQRDQDNQCVETSIALMDQQGRLLNGFGEYYYPELITYNSNPAVLINIATDGVLRLYPSQESLVSIPDAGYKSVIFSDDRFLVEQDGLLGYIDRTGRLAILPSFVAAQPFEDGKAMVIDKNGKLGAMTVQGMFYPEKYACILDLNNEYKLDKSSLSKVANDHYYRYVNVGGSLIRFSEDKRIHTNHFYISTAYQDDSNTEFCTGGKWGVIDKDDNLIVPAEYENVQIGQFFHLGQNETGKYALINLKGERISEFVYDDIKVISDDDKIMESKYLVAKLGDNWGMVTADNKIVIPFEYEELGPESEEFIAFRKDKKWGFLNINGQEVYAPIYSEVKPFSSGRSEAILEGAPTNLYRDESIRNVWMERERLMNK